MAHYVCFFAPIFIYQLRQYELRGFSDNFFINSIPSSYEIAIEQCRKYFENEIKHFSKKQVLSQTIEDIKILSSTSTLPDDLLYLSLVYRLATNSDLKEEDLIKNIISFLEQELLEQGWIEEPSNQKNPPPLPPKSDLIKSVPNKDSQLFKNLRFSVLGALFGASIVWLLMTKKLSSKK